MTASFEEIGAYKLSGVLVKEKELGHGSYATVLELDYMGIKCAGKRIHHLLLRDEEINTVTHRFTEECHLLSQIRHPNIVQFLGVYFQDGEIAPILVMEFLQCNLTTCIEKHGILPDEITYSILHDVAVGINYLHHQDPPIIHRDLSSNNILLTPNMTAKISDLGVAKILNLSQKLASRMTQNPGTLAFMPPEVLVANPKYDKSIDVFSYGILIIHMLSCRWPEPQLPQVKYEGNKLIPLTEAERREELLQIIGNDHPLMELIHRCIHNDVKQRAYSDEIVKKLELLVSRFPPTFANRLEIYQYIDSIKAQDDKDTADDELLTKAQELQDEILKCNNEFQEIKLAHTTKLKELQDRIRDLDVQKKDLSEKRSMIMEQLKMQEALLTQAIQSLQTVEKDIRHTYKEELKLCTNEMDESKDEQSKHEIEVAEIEKQQTMETQENTTSSEQSGPNIAMETELEQQTAGNQECNSKLSSKVRQKKSKRKSGDFDFFSLLVRSTRTDESSLKHDSTVTKEDESQSTSKKKSLWMSRTLGKAKDLLTSTSKQQTPRPEVTIEIDTSSTVALSGELPLGSPVNKSAKPLAPPVPVKIIKQSQKPTRNDSLYVGKYDYSGLKDDELSFKKGDLMKVISTDGKWWYACLVDSQQKGYIPSNYVVENTSLEAEEWFVGQLDQKEAEKLLMGQENQSGSYLVCKNTTKVASYTLYIRINDRMLMYPIHYQEKRGFLVTPQTSFSSVQDLVRYYQQKAEGLCSRLIKPCILPVQYQSIRTSNGREVALIRKISSDEFSHIWQGLMDKKVITVKVFRHTFVKNTRSLCMHEVQIMKKLDHNNIIRFLADCTGEEVYCIVTEFMQYGSLLSYLCSQSSEQSPPEAQLIGMAGQIAAAMRYLDEHKYIHRDLAARSVFVGNGLICKVGNFHSTIHTEQKDLTHNFDINPAIKWTAPEVIQSNHFSTKSDVWSFGILLYEIITLGATPYPNMTDAEVNQQVIKNHYRMPCPKGCPIELHFIMMQCWKLDHVCRPTFETLMWQLEDYYTQKDMYDAGYGRYT